MVTDKKALSRAVVGPNNLVVIKHDVDVGDKSARLAANITIVNRKRFEDPMVSPFDLI